MPSFFKSDPSDLMGNSTSTESPEWHETLQKSRPPSDTLFSLIVQKCQGRPQAPHARKSMAFQFYITIYFNPHLHALWKEELL